MSFFNFILVKDFPESGGWLFQDAATNSAIMISQVHNYISAYMVLIIGFVFWALMSLIKEPWNRSSILKYKNHGTMIEIIWTITPGILLVLMSIPSFQLLYALDEIQFPKLTFKGIGSQWYWTYNLNDNEKSAEFDSYLKSTEDLKLGELRLLEVDNRLKLPIGLPVRGIITSTDVIHCWTIPSLGVKIDACPGRLNQITFTILRKGIFTGNCSEICGTGHASMPITIEGVSVVNYLNWLDTL